MSTQSRDISRTPLRILNIVSIVIIVGTIVMVSLMMGACGAPSRPTHPATYTQPSPSASVALSVPVRKTDAADVCSVLYPPAWRDTLLCITAWTRHPAQTALCAVHFGPDAMGEDRSSSMHQRKSDSEDCLNSIDDRHGDSFPNAYSEIDPHRLYWTDEGFTWGLHGCGINIRGANGGPTC